MKGQYTVYVGYFWQLGDKLVPSYELIHPEGTQIGIGAIEVKSDKPNISDIELGGILKGERIKEWKGKSAVPVVVVNGKCRFYRSKNPGEDFGVCSPLETNLLREFKKGLRSVIPNIP